MHRIKQIIMTVITVMWMVVIFLFSADPAEESSEKSMGIGYAVADFFVADFQEWSSKERMEYVEKIEYPIRKVGHGMEYAVLGFLAMATTLLWKEKNKGKWTLFFFVWGITILYAVSDEIHQLFVPGRSCQITDVGIDSLGALLGIFSFLIGRRVVNRLFPHKDFCDKLKKEKESKDRNGA